MADGPFYAPNRKPDPPRPAKPGVLLFEFVRASNRAPVSRELRFQGRSYVGGAISGAGRALMSDGGFASRAQAVRWAEDERKAMEKGGA